MKSKSLILMVVSLGFGLVAAVGISQVMGRGTNVAAPKIQTGPVLVTTDTLDHNAVLSEANVKIENWPLQIIPENAATSFEQIESKALVTRMNKGLPILLSDLVDESEKKNLVIPNGFKVVAIPVSADDTIAGLLTPGDKVDVIGIFRTRKANEARSVSKTFLKAITVFSVGNKIRYDVKRESGTNGSAIVGVLLTARQAEQIVLVQKEAQIKLVLCGPDADEEENDGSLIDIFDYDDEEDKVAEKEDEDESNPGFGRLEPASFGKTDDSWTTRIWNGGDVEVFRYNGEGQLPEFEQSMSFGPKKTESFDDEPEFEDEEDFNQSSDDDRGLTEDEYPGE